MPNLVRVSFFFTFSIDLTIIYFIFLFFLIPPALAFPLLFSLFSNSSPSVLCPFLFITEFQCYPTVADPGGCPTHSDQNKPTYSKGRFGSAHFVSEGLVHGCLAPRTWTENHDSGYMWQRRHFCSWTKGQKAVRRRVGTRHNLQSHTPQ